jgi:geranylgeranyl reductase family protein
VLVQARYNRSVPPARFDVVVAGAGPAGSMAALVLSRGGARVALVDKASFPRDKACGDLIGPRAARLLGDLGLEPPGALPVGDLVVLGPRGGRALLPARAGLSYPGHGWALRRSQLDGWLRQAALDAGAEPVQARVTGVELTERPAKVHLDGTGALASDVVIGADGSTSPVAATCGLVDRGRILWGFAVRTYVPEEVDLPVVAFWDPEPGWAFPGYGWLFPGPGGWANAGLGIGAGHDRRQGMAATRGLEGFLAHLRRQGLLGTEPCAARLGGWVKMGMVGTVPARDRVLLVGDAAGLVNPLQGEGISQALDSGAAAARAILAGPGRAPIAYRAHLRSRHLDFQSSTAAIHAALVDRPRLVSVLGRALTTDLASRTIGAGWALYWNDLVNGASPGPGRRVATAADRLARWATSHGHSKRWLASVLARDAP